LLSWRCEKRLTGRTSALHQTAPIGLGRGSTGDARDNLVVCGPTGLSGR
jgi:hypothetical protein